MLMEHHVHAKSSLAWFTYDNTAAQVEDFKGCVRCFKNPTGRWFAKTKVFENGTDRIVSECKASLKKGGEYSLTTCLIRKLGDAFVKLHTENAAKAAEIQSNCSNRCSVMVDKAHHQLSWVKVNRTADTDPCKNDKCFAPIESGSSNLITKLDQVRQAATCLHDQSDKECIWVDEKKWKSGKFSSISPAAALVILGRLSFDINNFL